MSSEKLRRETAGFDISFTWNPDENFYTLEKPLPKHIDPSAFMGHVCTLKIRNAESIANGRTIVWDYFYGVVRTVEVTTKYYPETGEAERAYVQIAVLFSDVRYQHDIVIQFDYYPDEVDDSMTSCSIWGEWIDKHCTGGVDITSCKLTPSTDSQTGDVTYTASTTLYYANDLVGISRNGVIGLAVDGDPNNITVYNKIIAAYKKTKAITSNYMIVLGSYWKYTADKVVDPVVEVIYSSKEPDTFYFGQYKYTVNISFTVRAADVISV